MKNLRTHITEGFDSKADKADVNEALSFKDAFAKFADEDQPLLPGMSLDGFGHVKSIVAKDKDCKEIEVTFFDSKDKTTLVWDRGWERWTEK